MPLEYVYARDLVARAVGGAAAKAKARAREREREREGVSTTSVRVAAPNLSTTPPRLLPTLQDSLPSTAAVPGVVIVSEFSGCR